MSKLTLIVLCAFIGIGSGIPTRPTGGGNGGNGTGAPSDTLTINGIVFNLIGFKYYWIDANNTMNWHAAYDTCRRNYAHLATIESAEELEALNSYLSSLNKSFWVGGNDLAEEGKFLYASNGQPMTFGQPQPSTDSEDCVGIEPLHSNVYRMNDFNCYNKLYVLCEYDTSCMNVVIN